LGNSQALEQQLKAMLEQQQQAPQPNYIAGNLLNLLVHAKRFTRLRLFRANGFANRLAAGSTWQSQFRNADLDNLYVCRDVVAFHQSL